MKKFIWFILLFFAQQSVAQYKDQLSAKVSVAINANLETYFFAERLAVEHINNIVFDQKGGDYDHQPIVHFGYQHFSPNVNSPVIIRISKLIEQVRNTYYDNGPILNYLINQKEFPATGALYSELPADPAHPEIKPVLAELTDSLRSFYKQANVGAFLAENARFYKGAIYEFAKDVDAPSFPALEKWHGKAFSQYRVFLTPGMPVTKGEDNYRGFGPSIMSPEGLIPGMITSSDKMLPLMPSLAQYQQFGFDNPNVTHFLTRHEMGHSFVNPLLDKYRTQIVGDSVLYTPQLKEILAPHYINDWFVCVTEHLVRLAEIRTAVSMKSFKEAERLRKFHIYEEKCVLLPLLEVKIKQYESNRKRYPTFESYLPQLVAYFHSLTPEMINAQIKKYK
ncbi:DUF4932 domain-containing protein [Mucilaginibacter conchicola]|nr:DUF4932 domain-containing protein [Mucilaginibacter conchicola]